MALCIIYLRKRSGAPPDNAAAAENAAVGFSSDEESSTANEDIGTRRRLGAQDQGLNTPAPAQDSDSEAESAVRDLGDASGDVVRSD
ncbi:hypothetical protein HK405_005067 [Cladochytrium tenue]|nr:hypothetical protein HK405_005067 [Cladochytrium tenue]